MIETRKILVPRGYFLGPMTLDEYNYEQLRRRWAESCKRASELLVVYTDATEERDILHYKLKEYEQYMRNKNGHTK